MESKRKYTTDIESTDKPIGVHCFEDAVEKIGSGRFHIVLLLTSGIALLGVILEGLSMAFVLPAAKCEMEITSSEQGLINAVAFIGVVLTSHFWGFMADTWGRRKVILTALSTSFVFSVLSCLSTTSTMLLITRFGVGICISGVQAAAISYLGEFHSNKTRTKHVTLAAMFLTMAVAYQALMGLFIMPWNWEFSLFGLLLIKPWRVYIFIGSCTSLIAFVTMCFLPESPKFELSMGRKEEALEILIRAYVANGLGSPSIFPVKELALLDTKGSNLADAKGIVSMFRMVWIQTKPLMQKEHVGNVLMMCFLTFSSLAVAHGFYLWYPQVLALNYPFMDQPITICQAVSTTRSINQEVNSTHWQREDQHIDEGCVWTGESRTYYIILVMGSIFLVIFSFVAFNINRFGMKWLLTVWLVIAAVSALAMVWTNQFYLNVAMAILMLTCGNAGNILSAVAADLFPTHFKSMALCFIMMSARIGSVVGSNFVGALLFEHCEPMFGVFTGLLTVSVGVCYFVLHKKERTNLQGKYTT